MIGNVLNGGWRKEYPPPPVVLTAKHSRTGSAGLHKPLQRGTSGGTDTALASSVVSVGRADSPGTFLGRMQWEKLARALPGVWSPRQPAMGASNALVCFMPAAGLSCWDLGGDTRFSGVGQEHNVTLRHGTVRTKAPGIRTLTMTSVTTFWTPTRVLNYLLVFVFKANNRQSICDYLCRHEASQRLR